MRSSFASPDRAPAEILEQQISMISSHPLINCLIQAINGVFAVCNKDRQILSVNSSLLKLMGLSCPSSVIGLRPGEALNCIHARRCESGCGTSESCENCGAAIAMVTSLEKNEPVEKICAISVNHTRQKRDFYFLVKSTPLELENERIILLTMQDITRLQELQCMEKVFLHDVVNLSSALSGLSEFALDCEPEDLPLLLKTISNTTSRLLSEVKLQRTLTSETPENYVPRKQAMSLREVFEETIDAISGHPSTKNRKLRKPEILPDKKFLTDKALLIKVLQNMLLNAFENSDDGRAVRFWVDCGKTNLSFCVWNHRAIRKEMRGRIFQRNNTTKTEEGHGLGTFSMKTFGEIFLGGKISFESSEEQGTIFRFFLPLNEIENPTPD